MVVGFMTPAAKTLFKKRVLDSQKFLLHGACILLSFVTVVPIGTGVDSPLEKKISARENKFAKLALAKNEGYQNFNVDIYFPICYFEY
jgi:hypothetical protein